MQFAFIESDEALRQVIEGGDFGAWRVFLHPEQERYATHDFNGPFRLTGGAGTGKTVVLLHRARHLARHEPSAAIVLTTYTRALAENLDRDLATLDPDLTRATHLGAPGIYVRGVDALAHAVRMKAGAASFARASTLVFGTPIGGVSSTVGNADGWRAALEDVQPSLPDELVHESFFEGEYLQVILPARISTAEEYSAVRRPGRGVALDRAKRGEVSKVVSRYRDNARQSHRLSYAEVAAIGAAWLDMFGESNGMLVDHVLVDEGQDLTPPHWQFLRSLARAGVNDLLLAEDTHQRIYGQHVVLSRYGIRIVGRSRRLTLNYRTTEQNLRSALRILAPAEFTDSENDTEALIGYRSSRSGPEPIRLPAVDDQSQLDLIGGLVEEWLATGVEPATIAVLARTNERATIVRDGLNQRGVALNLIKSPKAEGDRPLVLTMHTSKGMEFSRAVLFDISDGCVPLPAAINAAAPDERNDALLRERSLLYVASSRARDVLAISWKAKPSELLGLV
ncbi:3'-5' exonuclease [Humibacter sp.]|uniref:3'-5' exonuclease n=1 Tax=Humibacter sp. TaxID=1940291 RepID=UPI003F7E5A20